MRYFCILLALLAPSLLHAQATVTSDARLLSSPSGRALATFRAGAAVQPGATRSGATQVTLQGYIHRSLLGAARDSFRISVNASSGALLRATPSRSGRVLALLHNGMGLHEVNRRGEWVQVRRTAWVATSAVERPRQAARPPQQPAARTTVASPAEAASAVAAAAATDSAPGSLDAEAAATTPISEDMTPMRRAELASAPGGGGTLGSVEPGTRLVPLARDNGWVRVRMEGWVPEEALAAADTTLRTVLSAADIRANPDAAKGRPIRWQVQVLAFQTADQLRRDMKTDEPYLLARGPTGENAILYLALPEPLVASARGIPALATVVVTGRVRVGQSKPAGVPIIDVQSITRQ